MSELYRKRQISCTYENHGIFETVVLKVSWFLGEEVQNGESHTRNASSQMGSDH